MLDDFDHVFLFIENSVDAVQKVTTAPCSYLAAGADCLLATPIGRPQSHRAIDVYGMGRMDEDAHQELKQLTIDQKLFYVWDRSPILAVKDFAEARLRTYHMIRNSRFFASFNFSTGRKRLESVGEEAIPARVFEGAAAGSVLFGTSPKMAEYDALFDWPDSHIDVDLGDGCVEEAFRKIEAEPERYRRGGLLNAVNSLLRHDWAYRLEDILSTIGMSPMPSLLQRKAKLARLAEEGRQLLASHAA